MSTGLHIFHVHPPFNESGYGPVSGGELVLWECLYQDYDSSVKFQCSYHDYYIVTSSLLIAGIVYSLLQVSLVFHLLYLMLSLPG